MNINRNYLELQESYLFSTIAKKVSEFKANHPDKKVIRMGIGDVTLPLCKAVTDAMEKAVVEMGRKETFRGYGPEQGYGFLTSALSAYYQKRNVSLEEHEIFVSDGAKSDLGNILDIFSVDNTVLIPDPVYPVYVDTNIMAGRNIAYMDATAENGFLPLPDESVQADIIYLCSPNNPTGAVMGREDLLALARVLEDTDVVVISDEIYAELTYGADHVSIASIPSMFDRTIVINGFSKAFAMTGWRLGYAIAHPALLGAMLKIHQFTMLCANIMSQYAGVEALRHGLDSGFASVDAMRREYDRRRNYIVAGLNRMGLTCFEPRGAFYAFPSIQSTGMKSEEFCEKLLYAKQVAVVPGTAFGSFGEGFVRISYAASLENIKTALGRIEEFIEGR